MLLKKELLALYGKGLEPDLGLRKRYFYAIFPHFCEVKQMSLICPQCQSSHTRKAGISRHGHQRWLCKGCGRTAGGAAAQGPAGRQRTLPGQGDVRGRGRCQRLERAQHHTVVRGRAARRLASPFRRRLRHHWPGRHHSAHEHAEPGLSQGADDGLRRARPQEQRPRPQRVFARALRQKTHRCCGPGDCQPAGGLSYASNRAVSLMWWARAAIKSIVIHHICDWSIALQRTKRAICFEGGGCGMVKFWNLFQIFIIENSIIN